MQAESKSEFIQGLRLLADKLEQCDDGTVNALFNTGWSKIVYPVIGVGYQTKEMVATAIRTLGGKWTKKLIGDDNYSFFQISSEKFPISISISRDKVCKKTVSYDCQPMFSPEEEAELEGVLSGD